MANIKKATLKELVERLEAVEKWRERVETYAVKHDAPNDPALQRLSSTSIGFIPGPNPEDVAGGTIADVKVLPTVKRKCETNPCNNMDTKEYQGRLGKMWLCETHKL